MRISNGIPSELRRGYKEIWANCSRTAVEATEPLRPCDSPAAKLHSAQQILGLVMVGRTDHSEISRAEFSRPLRGTPSVSPDPHPTVRHRPPMFALRRPLVILSRDSIDVLIYSTNQKSESNVKSKQSFGFLIQPRHNVTV